MVSNTGASNGVRGGVAGVLSDPRQAMDGGINEADAVAAKSDPKASKKKAEQKEEGLVNKRWTGYEKARKFDEPFRKQVALDRKYAAGTSDLSWAVTTNLIGAFIDILTALLYARDPDVSATKAPQVDDAGTANMDQFAKTLQIVISNLWRKGKLKRPARKAVRSVLSNSEGWFKATMMAEKVPQPEVETKLNDAKETLRRLQAQKQLLEDNTFENEDDLDAALSKKEKLIEALNSDLELAVNKMFVIDYVSTELMQVSTDVTNIADYLDANWIANEMFMDKEEVLERFGGEEGRLTPEDVKQAKQYFQTAPMELTNRETNNALPQGILTAESAQAFTESPTEGESLPFLRVVEQWDRRDKHIYTMIDGIKKWAKEPYEPPYPTSRFYPYFYFAFYEVDGSRHPQSLSWRLYKLQDEYSAARSNFRITRERSIPGVLFNATMIDDDQAQKISKSKHQEYVAITPADPDTPLANCFAPKPVQGIDMRIFETTEIMNDMERMSGVQEALSAAINAPGNPKTATEANIEQSGTNARTTSDRDQLEWCLTEMAQATAEQAIQCLTLRDVQRMAGPKAFWPEGMAIEDLFTLVEVEIQAGTTGKPKSQVDQQAWATILPLIRELIGQIEQALNLGNEPLANALIELIKETMVRLGDESDVDRFVPRVAAPGSPGSGAPPQQPKPPVTISLRGEITPDVANAIAQPDVPAPPPALPNPAIGAGAPVATPSTGVPPVSVAGPTAPHVGP
jgi:hypothetical protein